MRARSLLRIQCRNIIIAMLNIAEIRRLLEIVSSGSPDHAIIGFRILGDKAYITRCHAQNSS
eukprot:1292564-Amorphochlora_amoeboformis.AAC.1